MRTAVFVDPSHHTRSASVAGPNVHSQWRTSSAQPASDSIGVISSPSQLAIDVHNGREIRQCPALRPRTTSPAAARIVRSRDIVDTSADHFVPGAAVNVPPRWGSASRNSRAESSAPVRRSTICFDAAAIQSAPSCPSRRRPPWRAAGVRPRRPVAGTAGHRGKQLTSDDEQGPPHRHRLDERPLVVRARPRRRSTVSSRTRACRARCGVVGSVACSAVIAVVAAAMSPYRWSAVQAVPAGDPGPAMIVGHSEHESLCAG